MEWLSKATNWTRFSATAQLGVVHKGNMRNSFNLLSPYLPQESSVNSSHYTEGFSRVAHLLKVVLCLHWE
jgi:26S proteasome regulatory subunit N2